MLGFNLLTAMLILGTATAAAVATWVQRARYCQQRLKQMEISWLARLQKSQQQIEDLQAAVEAQQAAVEAEKAALQKQMAAGKMVRDEYNAAREKFVLLQRELTFLGEQKDRLQNDSGTLENALDSARQRNSELQSEISKIQSIHQAKLASEKEERKALQRKHDDAKSEQQSLNNLLKAARFEHESVSKLLTAAQAKRHDQSELEGKVAELEAENVRLQHDAALANREAELMRRDVDQIDSLKDQNNQLTRCLASMDTSRKQYEEDARRYRDQYEKSEKESDTLRFMLGDVEKHWSRTRDNEKSRASSMNGEDKSPTSIFLTKPDGEIDDLTEIVGIGRVFEKTLHDLGIYHFRQIAALGKFEIAQINSALKEFAGRIENDDWVGQATALQFEKYGKL
jgi:predicted flap endonuclease-1-like 5' DNA nuclease